MIRMTSISALAIALAMTGGAHAQETLEQFKLRCEASGYTDLEECRKFMSMDTITNQVDIPVEQTMPVDEDAVDAEEPAVTPDETLIEVPPGNTVVPGSSVTQPTVPYVSTPSGIPVTTGSPSGIPVAPGPTGVNGPTGIPVAPIQVAPAR